MNQIIYYKRLLFIMIAAISQTNIALAQTTKPKTAQPQTKSTQNCGCDYYPICNPDVTKSFNGKVYKGIRNLDESIDYFNCDDGVVTRIISRRVPTVATNAYGEYYDTYKTENSMITVLKTKSPVGSTWTNPTGDDFFTDYYTIEAKDLSLTINEKQYINVIKVRAITKIKKTEEEYTKEYDTYSFITKSYVYKNTLYNNGEVFKAAQDYYFDKSKGLIKSENVWEELKAKIMSEKNVIIIDNSKHPFFKTLSENIWMAGFTIAGFEKTGKYSLAWAEDGKVNQENGYWRITGNWIEISKSAQNAVWKKMYEMVKSDNSNTVLKKDSEVFYPSPIPIEQRQ